MSKRIKVLCRIHPHINDNELLSAVVECQEWETDPDFPRCFCTKGFLIHKSNVEFVSEPYAQNNGEKWALVEGIEISRHAHTVRVRMSRGWEGYIIKEFVIERAQDIRSVTPENQKKEQSMNERKIYTINLDALPARRSSGRPTKFQELGTLEVGQGFDVEGTKEIRSLRSCIQGFYKRNGKARVFSVRQTDGDCAVCVRVR